MDQNKSTWRISSRTVPSQETHLGMRCLPTTAIFGQVSYHHIGKSLMSNLHYIITDVQKDNFRRKFRKLLDELPPPREAATGE